MQVLPHQAQMKMTVQCSSTMSKASPKLSRPKGKLPAIMRMTNTGVSLMLTLYSDHFLHAGSACQCTFRFIPKYIGFSPPVRS